MNKNRIFMAIFLVFIIFVIGITGNAISDQGKILDVQPIIQENQVWCWAASAQMIMDYHYENIGQHRQAGDLRGRTEYRVVIREYLGKPELTPGVPPVAPDFSLYGFRSSWGGALKWDVLKNEIDNNRPFGFSWIYDSGFNVLQIPQENQLTDISHNETGILISQDEPGGGHYMVVIGYQVENEDKYVWIIDPRGIDGIATPERIPYDEYREDAEYGYKHYIDQYEIMK